MNNVKIGIATIIMYFLFMYDYYVMWFFYSLFFELNLTEHIAGGPAAWKIVVFGSVCYATIYPLLTCVLSALLQIAREKIKYVFVSIAGLSVAGYVIMVLFMDEPLIRPRLAFVGVICFVALAMLNADLESEEETQ